MTVEDPIEFLHSHKKCVVNQRELGADTPSFALALRAALRQDPDVILVGEMRDLETISTALTAAETGHLVFATLHTQSAAQTIDRIIDVFPPHQQGQVRVQLSVALEGVMTQQLLPTADGSSRVAAIETLVPTPAVRNLIREGKTHQIVSVMQTGAGVGMQTMDAALATLVRSGQDHPAPRRGALLDPRRAASPARLRRPGQHGGLGASDERLRLEGDGPHRGEGHRRGRCRHQAGRRRPAQGPRPDRPRHLRQAQLEGDQPLVPEADQADGPDDHDPSAVDDGQLRHDDPARALRARGADRERAADRDDHAASARTSRPAWRSATRSSATRRSSRRCSSR